MSNLYSNSIFWIDLDKIHPNPYQPRREFENDKLHDLSNSIRMYGILQPLTVSRVEKMKDDGGMVTDYELIAGERRLRASKLAGLTQVPCVVRVGDDNLMKLELAIIENLQREDLNAIERARAFHRFVNEFKYTHAQIGAKMGKSREYVSNTLRILQLPEEILTAVSEGKLSEGHTRPLMMLQDRPQEQMVLFKEAMFKKISVREAERIARKIAFERVRKLAPSDDPEILEMEELLQETFGTRVHIDRKPNTKIGKITIDFFSPDDLKQIFGTIRRSGDMPTKSPDEMLARHIASVEAQNHIEPLTGVETAEGANYDAVSFASEIEQNPDLLDDRTPDEKANEKDEDADLYNIDKFAV